MSRTTLEIEAIGARIREVRLKTNMSQRDLAKLMETSRTYISKVENNGAHPTIKNLYRFAAALKTDIFTLLPRDASNHLDPFMQEISDLASTMTISQRANVLRVAKEMTIHNHGLPGVTL
jgi:putative transcriptional regulator